MKRRGCTRLCTLAVLAATGLASACVYQPYGSPSVAAGVAVPAPWSTVAVGGPVPVGPYVGGGYGPVW
jgi:hypothetical protein